MKYKIVRLSPHPIALFVAAGAFLYSFATVLMALFPYARLIGSELLFEVAQAEHLRFALTPVLTFVGGYLAAFVSVLMFNALAKITGGVVIETGKFESQ